MTLAYEGRPLRSTIELYHDLIPWLGGITMRDFFLDGERCAEAWARALPEIERRYPDFGLEPRVMAAPLSYGHVICLGCPVDFPEDSEPNVRPILNSIDEGIALLEEASSRDFGAQPIYRHYREVWRTLRGRFPELTQRIGSLGVEGPLTSAVLLRGQDFFMDLYDEPERVRTFLDLLTANAIAFIHTIRRENGEDEMQTSGGLADDFASLVPHYFWEDFVLPYWEQYFAGICTKRRMLHCENLLPQHLPYLNRLQLAQFQASVSQQLTLADMAVLDMPYDWLLTVPEMMAMSQTEIVDWVDDTVAAGVPVIRAQIGRYVAETPGGIERLRCFLGAFERYAVAD